MMFNNNLKKFSERLKDLGKKVFQENKSLGKGIEKAGNQGFINPFIDIEVIYRGETLIHESLAMLINTRLKDYNLMPKDIGVNNTPVINLVLPTGSMMKFNLIVKNLDEKLYKQRGDGLPKS